MPLDKPPVRLCCMQRHWGIVCPDDKVMCDLCFERFDIDQLYVDEEGQKWDVCVPCDAADKEAVRRRNERNGD